MRFTSTGRNGRGLPADAATRTPVNWRDGWVIVRGRWQPGGAKEQGDADGDGSGEVRRVNEHVDAADMQREVQGSGKQP